MSADRIDPTTLTLSRLVAAPRTEVFRAWTEPELAAAGASARSPCLTWACLR